ncbi:MAG: hypothetical protein KC613_10515 [Myxococcales bacterium]|nr:hypothetical protein [Myxococcales bacterium]MCB9525139.1 hypothetical protein [Myxococcales bacterium]
MNARTQIDTDVSPRATAGLLCLAVAMAGAGLSGAIVSGASDVVHSALMPTWATQGGVGAVAASLLVAGSSALVGWLGYRWWRPEGSAG